jgi:hypothetical protein
MRAAAITGNLYQNDIPLNFIISPPKDVVLFAELKSDSAPIVPSLWRDQVNLEGVPVRKLGGSFAR